MCIRDSCTDPSSFTYAILKALSEAYDFDLNTPYEELPEEIRHMLIHGTDGREVMVHYKGQRGEGIYPVSYTHLTTETTNTVYSYFVDELIDQVKADLVEKAGYTDSQASNALYSSGLKIYSTQSPSIQKAQDEEFANEENFPSNVKGGIELSLIHI